MKAGSTPEVTVLMPVYNGEHFLRTALESILRQSLTDLELLLVDDGSTDRSAEIMDSYAHRDARVRVLRHGRNEGLIRSLNRGIEESTGRYIARMDADDRSHPQRLERQRDYLDAHPEIGVVGTQYRLIDDLDRFLPQSVRLPTDPVAVRWRMFFECALAHPTIMIRPDTYRRLGAYDDSFVAAEDYELWLRWNESIKFANLDMVLHDLRRHSGSVTGTQGQLTGSNSERAITLALTRLLNHPIEPVVASILLAPEKAPDQNPPSAVFAAVTTIHELANKLLSLGDLNLRERDFIERDAAWILCRLVAFCITKRPEVAVQILRNSDLLPTPLAVRLLVLGAARRLRWEVTRRRWEAAVAP